ncbi:hypothetical protein DXG01_004422 [Tephrocybe rancida]|nr:hypothetical protein DXG01_004422 [Tephrocybe rancida]
MSDLSSRPSFPILTFLVLPDILLALVLALDLSKKTRICFFIGFALICYKSLQHTTGDKFTDYSMGTTVGGQFFTALHLLLFVRPLREYRHLEDKDDPRKKSLIRRVYWSGCVIHSPRGVGWNYQIPNISPTPSTPNTRFILSRLLHALLCLFLLDAAQSFIHIYPLLLPSRDQGLAHRVLYSAAWMLMPYAGLRMQYYLLSAVSVALGLSSPKAWPEPYGSLREAYTVRNLWGARDMFYLRAREQYLTPFGKSTSKILGLKPGSRLSSLTQLLVAFLISGAMHAFGDAMVGWDHLGSSVPFFLLQVLAIVAEELTGVGGKQ